ncbi:MAG TPA: helix-turn-helix domain-containing protein [Patescibacteria group bacterium]|nr:helix-turn-helix domain-containing protein [Patescibacteria group bacterium]
MSFVFKRVNSSDHIGPDLIELRERVGWDRKEASRQTRLTESFISALENESWDEIGDPWYAERMMRAYVKFLGGNENYFLQKFRHCLGEDRLKPAPKNQRLIRPIRVRLLDMAVGSRILAVAGFILFVGVLGAYVYREARQISAPPPISIDEPAEGIRLTEPKVTIKGKTVPEASVTINGQTAIVEPDGSFHFDLDVPRGTTMIIISAQKRHSQEAEAVRHVVYDRPLPPLLGPNATDTEP